MNRLVYSQNVTGVHGCLLLFWREDLYREGRDSGERVANETQVPNMGG